MTALTYKPTRALATLAATDGLNLLGYYGTLTILMLYATHILGLSHQTAYLLFGAYAAFAYSIPMLGGFLADHVMGGKRVILAGALLNILGNILLVLPYRRMFCLGLAASLMGYGLTKNNIACAVGDLYKDDIAKKQNAFTWLYLALNIGGTLGPLIYGTIAYFFKWNWVFLFNVFSLSIGLSFFLRYWNFWKTTPEIQKYKQIVAYLAILILVLTISFIFYRPSSSILVILGLFLAAAAFVISRISKYSGKEKSHLIALTILCIFGMFYYAAGLQTGSSVMLFLQQKIQLGIVKTKMPASAFGTLYCFFVLVLAPLSPYFRKLLLAKNIIITAPFKLSIGLALAALGIGAFAFAACSSFILTGIIFGNLLLSAGELVIAPAMYTIISDKSPEKIKSSMMACWALSIGFGSYLSTLLARVAHFTVTKMSFLGSAFLGQFLFMAAFTLAVALIAALVAMRVQRALD